MATAGGSSSVRSDVPFYLLAALAGVGTGWLDVILDDLLFTGHVKAFDLMERPGVPRQTRNATGDRIETDGRVAALQLD